MKHVPLSTFFCQELLYDYHQGQLDEARMEEVRVFLQTDEECRFELERLKNAAAYCQELATVQPPPEWIERWQHLPPALAERISIWETKVIRRFWSALPTIVIILLVGLGAWLLKPWKSVAPREIIVWSPQTPPAEPPKVVKQEASLPPVENPPPSPTASTSVLLPKTWNLLPTLIPDFFGIMPSPLEFVPPPLMVTMQPIVAAIHRQTQKRDEADDDEASAHADSETRSKMKGELYRGQITTAEFEQDTEEIKNKIIELGGERARKVELGWHRKSDESYFHFTLPESKLSQLNDFLVDIGPVRISKEKHPLVMPAGRIRIILIVKEAHANDHEDQTEAR